MSKHGGAADEGAQAVQQMMMVERKITERSSLRQNRNEITY